MSERQVTTDKDAEIERLRAALVQARSDLHLIALENDAGRIWAMAKEGRERVHTALEGVVTESDASVPVNAP